MSENESVGLPDSEAFRNIWNNCSDVQKQYILNRQSSKSKTKATEGLGIHPRTIYGWDDDVEKCVELLRNHIFDATIAELQSLALKATFRLREMLYDDDLRPQMQIQVIKQVLNRTVGDAALPQDHKEAKDHQETIEVIVKNPNDE